MRSVPTRLDGPLLLSPRVHGDERGFFCETFRAAELAQEHGITEAFVQDNHSRSRRGTVRGMHFAIGDGSSKLVRCGRGAIFDVLVDLRRGSATFGQWESSVLDEDNMHVLYVPVGFAHGFAVTSDIADVLYKQSAYYSAEVERGVDLDDPELGIAWPDLGSQRVVSQRDRDAPRLADVAAALPFVLPAG